MPWFVLEPAAKEEKEDITTELPAATAPRRHHRLHTRGPASPQHARRRIWAASGGSPDAGVRQE